MRYIGLHFPAAIRAAGAGVMLALLAVGSASCADKPQYGGLLRVELRAASVTLNPARWKAGSPDYATNERLAALLFDRLVALDSYGRFQPQLATEWTRDGSGRHWQFVLRQGVRFSDGSPVTPADVVAALRTILPAGVQVSGTGTGVAIQSASPLNDLLEILSSGPNFIYKTDTHGNLLGTGPFVVETAAGTSLPKSADDPPASASARTAITQKLRFRFNDDCWSGRPFLDQIEVTLGVPSMKGLLDVQLGLADVAELSEDTARRARQSGLRTWSSSPATLYALRFAGPAKTESDKSLREALQLAVDRPAMARVLLQRQAEPAASFLPQWLSGYAFLFETESDLDRAKKLRANLPANSAGVAQPLRVSVESGNESAKLIGERIAVNARAAGLTLQLTAKGRSTSDGPATKPEAELIAWRCDTLAPRRLLQEAAAAWNWNVPEGGIPEVADARYAWEKKMMDDRQMIPLVMVPDFAALDGRVRNWSPTAWGEWQLAEVWLDSMETSGTSRAATRPNQAGAKP